MTQSCSSRVLGLLQWLLLPEYATAFQLYLTAMRLYVAAYQNAIRDQKLAAEISAAKRERDFYMGQVDKAKGIEAMKERKRKVSTKFLQVNSSATTNFGTSW